jgi:hypothetical protein
MYFRELKTKKSASGLERITDFFTSYELVEVEGIYYLDDKYFDYKYNMQRICGGDSLYKKRMLLVWF